MKSLSIRIKLIIGFAGLAILASIITGITSYWKAEGAIENQVLTNLKNIRNFRATAVEDYMTGLRQKVSTFAQQQIVISALHDFSKAYEELKKKPTSPEINNGLKDYYRTTFFKKLKERGQTLPALDDVMPSGNAARYLQYFYMAQNPNPVGQKDRLKFADDGSRYSQFHKKYHPVFDSFLNKFGFYDIFLVDGKTGDIVYTVFKESDFATNLRQGPYSKSNLASDFSIALASNETDYAHLTDFKFYLPSYGAPAAFIASPVYEQGQKTGVLVFQIPINKINGILTGKKHWQKDGLGNSGETFLVADDYKMRSASRFLIEDSKKYLHDLEKSGYKKHELDQIAANKSPILVQTIKTKATRDVFNGKSGATILSDYRGIDVLNAYKPLNIKDVNWALIAKIDVAEAFAPVYGLRNSLLFWSVIILFAAAGAGFWYSTRLATPIEMITQIAKNAAIGHLEQNIPFDGKDEIGQLGQAFRDLNQALKEKSAALENIAGGNLDIAFEPSSEFDTLGKSVKTMKETLAKLLDQFGKVIKEQNAGQLDARCETNGFGGAYKDMLAGLNQALQAVTEPFNASIRVIGSYARGEFSERMSQLPGQQKSLSDAMDAIRENLVNVIQEGVEITRQALDGNLTYRGDATPFFGAYKQIIEGINATLDATTQPISEAQKVLQQAALGDLTASVQGHYKGDHSLIKHALNDTLKSLNETLGQVNGTIQQVSNGARQVSDSSQTVSQGATEQASALQEIAASMTEISSQAKNNADNADQAQIISESTKSAAASGNQQMKMMMEAIEEINASSKDISKIIKTIDEIAFQTNLLALNAAVEAARAGVHGKGFAVVAEEVRNLAQRSAKAAEETTAMIEESVQKATHGLEIAERTDKALNEIVQGIQKSTDIINEITSASKEQVSGIEQTTLALGQIDKVTQSNTASAEETAAASQELSAQSAYLKQLVSKFIVTETSFVHQESLQTDDDEIKDDKVAPVVEFEPQVEKNDEITIDLSDHDFGDF